MFTLIHVVISVLGIISGLVVVGGLIAGRRLDGWTGLFLLTTIITSASGFGFPFTKLLPSHIVGVISLVVLAPTQQEPPFAVTQAVILALLVWLGGRRCADSGCQRPLAERT